MRIHRLDKPPSEDNMTDTVAEVFQEYPLVFDAFLKKFASASSNNTPDAIYLRSKLSHLFPETDLGSAANRIPDIVCFCKTLIVLFESKKSARFTENQLEEYEQALERARGAREVLLFLIAPKSSIYEHYPHSYRFLTWDNVFDFFREHPQLHNHANKLEMFRLERYREILDSVVDQLQTRLPAKPQRFSANKYHGYHLQLPHSASMLFALSIYLSAPRYAKLFPFWLLNKKVKMNNGSHPIVLEYRKRLLRLQGTDHHLERQCPGYVIDLFQSPENTIDSIVSEIDSLFEKECRQMVDIFASINSERLQ